MGMLGDRKQGVLQLLSQVLGGLETRKIMERDHSGLVGHAGDRQQSISKQEMGWAPTLLPWGRTCLEVMLILQWWFPETADNCAPAGGWGQAWTLSSAQFGPRFKFPEPEEESLEIGVSLRRTSGCVSGDRYSGWVLYLDGEQ